MFAVLTIKSKGTFTINLSKVLFFYDSKKGTRLEMEDGTLLDVLEDYEKINLLLDGFNALKIPN